MYHMLYYIKNIGGKVMSDLSTTSCCGNSKSDTGMNSMFMILMLLLLCGGENGISGFGNGNSNCGCSGLDGILPIILLLSSCGGAC